MLSTTPRVRLATFACALRCGPLRCQQPFGRLHGASRQSSPVAEGGRTAWEAAHRAGHPSRSF